MQAGARATQNLSLERPRRLASRPVQRQTARDLPFYDSWVDHPGWAVTPERLLQVFRLAELGYPQRQCDTIDDLIESDAHTRNLFEQRDLAVAGKPWGIEEGEDANDDPDALLGALVLGRAMRKLPMRATWIHLLGFNRYGYSGSEIDWGTIAFRDRIWVVPSCLTNVQARRFRIGTQGMMNEDGSPVRYNELRILTDLGKPMGEDLEPGKWLQIKRGGTWLARAGLMRTAAWYIMAKRYGFRDWLVYNERFGLPMAIASYDREVDDKAALTAEEIVRNIGSDSGAAVPKDIELKIVEAAKAAGGKLTFGELIAFCNAELSKLINGSTLSNDNAGSGGASYALGRVHESVRWEYVDFDAGLLEEAFGQCVAQPFMRYNALDEALAPRLVIRTARTEEPNQVIEQFVLAKNELGVEVSQSQFREMTGIRAPINDADKAPGMQVKSFPVAAGGKPA